MSWDANVEQRNLWATSLGKLLIRSELNAPFFFQERRSAESEEHTELNNAQQNSAEINYQSMTEQIPQVQKETVV